MIITRFAVQFSGIRANEPVNYEAIGTGATGDKQFAHLYTTYALAEKKASYYKKNKQWYKDVKIVPVTVNWPDE